MNEMLAGLVASALIFLPILALILRNNANATRVVIKRFETDAGKLDKALEEIQSLKDKHQQDALAISEERGGLKQQIADLKEQIGIEREASEKRSTTNTEKLVEMQTQLTLMQNAQQALIGQIQVVTEERDRIQRELLTATQELILIRNRENELLETIATLQEQLRQRDDALETLRLQLNGSSESS